MEASESRSSLWPVTRLDAAGAFGDIGVLFPIAIALISLNHMNPTAVFLLAGLAYILAGGYFGVPVAVQPFKAVAAIALALALPPSTIAAAGLLMGALIAVIGLTNLVTPLARLFTLPLIRGIQLGLGLLLAREGFRLMLFRSDSGIHLVGGSTVPGWAIALAGAGMLAIFLRSRRFPAALVLLGAGVTFGVLAGASALERFSWGPVPLELIRPGAAELRRALFALVVPQFALTFANSVVATENTARVLFGPKSQKVTARALTLSIGVINLVGGAMQAAPLCHGSGGFTAHFRFGARSPKSSYIIGGVCLLLALFGQAAVSVLNVIPTAVLGVFLAYVGIQHAALVRDILRRPSALIVAGCVGVVSLVAVNLTMGFVVGFALEGILWLWARLRRGEARPAES